MGVARKLGTEESSRTPGGNGLPLPRCLSLDLEISVRDERIRAFAGVRPDTGGRMIFPGTGDSLDAALARLDVFAEGAEFLLGHNIIAFDLPRLRAASPSLWLLRLPAVDTLMLNPLAYPRNPYHHLVKHYQDGQLQRGRINDPELDAKLTLKVFDNQQKKLREEAPDLLAAWHWLTSADDGPGFDSVFTVLRRSPRPSDGEAYRAIHARLAGNACRTHAREVMARRGTARMGAGLCAGVVVGGREQLGDATLGSPSIPRGGAAGAPIAGCRMRRCRLAIGAGTPPRRSQGAQALVPLY